MAERAPLAAKCSAPLGVIQGIRCPKVHGLPVELQQAGKQNVAGVRWVVKSVAVQEEVLSTRMQDKPGAGFTARPEVKYQETVQEQTGASRVINSGQWIEE